MGTKKARKRKLVITWNKKGRKNEYKEEEKNEIRQGIQKTGKRRVGNINERDSWVKIFLTKYF